LFNRHYVKSGIVSKEKGHLYNRLFDLRQEGDYIDFVSLDEETVAPLIEATAQFVDTVQSLLDETENTN